MNGINDVAVGPGGFVPPNPGGGTNGGTHGSNNPLNAPRGLGEQPQAFTAFHDTRRPHAGDTALAGNNPLVEIGRASCRERV
jgi:type VI secretion system protein ImpK